MLKNAYLRVFNCKYRCRYSRKRATFCKTHFQKMATALPTKAHGVAGFRLQVPGSPRSTLFQKAKERFSICLLALFRSSICVHSFQYSSFCNFFTVARRCPIFFPSQVGLVVCRQIFLEIITFARSFKRSLKLKSQEHVRLLSHVFSLSDASACSTMHTKVRTKGGNGRKVYSLLDSYP